MKKLRVAIVSPFPPSKNTLNEYAHHLVGHLKDKAEIEAITVLTDELPNGATYPETSSDSNIEIQSVWKFNSLTNIYKIVRAIKKSKADVVLFNIHFMSFGEGKIPAALGLLTPYLARLSGVKTMVLLHNIVETVDLTSAGFTKNKLAGAVYEFIGTMLTRFILRADMVAVTISKYVEILRSKYKAKNVVLIPHGSFETLDKPNHEIPEGPKQIMAFGKFGTYKKAEGLIEAVKIIRSRTNLDLEIVIAGTDSPNCPGYLKSVEESYSDVPQLRFTGYVAEEDVPKTFCDSTVVVFPYTSTTGSSGVLHQAGSYAKACVLPNIGDLKVLIEEEGYRGVYFAPDNPESLAEAIQSLLEDDALRKKMEEANFVAATGLPMSEIANWYVNHFTFLTRGNKNLRVTHKNKKLIKAKAKQVV